MNPPAGLADMLVRRAAEWPAARTKLPLPADASNLLAALKQDPKKTGVLGVLTLVLAVMGGRLWLTGGPSASSAAASPRARATLTPAGPIALRVPSLDASAAVLRQWRAQPAANLTRNPFTSDLFAAPAKPAVVAPAAPVVAGDEGLFWRQLERALATQSEREQYRARMSAAALRDAADLVLLSVITGGDDRALVNDRLVGVGDPLAAPTAQGAPFVVEFVEQRRVVLRRDGVRVELLLGRREPKLAAD